MKNTSRFYETWKDTEKPAKQPPCDGALSVIIIYSTLSIHYVQSANNPTFFYSNLTFCRVNYHSYVGHVVLRHIYVWSCFRTYNAEKFMEMLFVESSMYDAHEFTLHAIQLHYVAGSKNLHHSLSFSNKPTIL